MALNHKGGGSIRALPLAPPLIILLFRFFPLALSARNAGKIFRQQTRLEIQETVFPGAEFQIFNKEAYAPSVVVMQRKDGTTENFNSIIQEKRRFRKKLGKRRSITERNPFSCRIPRKSPSFSSLHTRDTSQTRRRDIYPIYSVSIPP